MKAIVYTSNTGTTKAYAELLSDKTGLPLYTLSEAEHTIPAGSPVIYLGWLMASEIKGYKRASRKFTVKAVCAVGMGATGSQAAETAKKNGIPVEVPLFTLQGGFYFEKLNPMHKLMMKMMIDTVGKKLDQKPDRTPEEDRMLGMMRHGGDFVSEENLGACLAWAQGQGLL